MSKQKKKITYKQIRDLRGVYYDVLVNGETVAACRQVKDSSSEKWNAWAMETHRTHWVDGARTRAVATKAILALLEIEVDS